MTQYSRFFGGPEGSIPEYNQNHMAEVFQRLLSDGVFENVLNELAVTETDPVSLGVKVDTGWAFIQGFWYHNDSALTKTLGAADPDHARIDRIVLRLDTNTDFEITVEVLEGTPSADPSAPALTQTDSIYEIELAQIEVGATVTSISNANITDGRDYVTSSVDDIATVLSDISTLQTDLGTAEDDIDELEINVESVVTHTSNQLTPTRNSKKNVLKVSALDGDAQLQTPSGLEAEDMLRVEITDDGTPRNITYTSDYESGTAEMITATTAGTRAVMLFIYNGSKLVCEYAGEDV